MPGSHPRSNRFFRHVAVRGATALFAASLTAKLAGVATLYVTGVFLSKDDFALYAIALAWGEIFGFMQNGGLHRILVQRARSFDRLYSPILGLSFIINGLWLLILVIMAPFVASAYRAEGVTVLIVLFGFSIPTETIARLLRAYLMVNLRFTELSALNVYSTLIRNIGVIVLAVAGFGPISFMIPLIAVGVFESVFLCRKRPRSWRPSLPGRRFLRAISAPLLWVMTSTLALSIVANGDYLVIGAWTEKAVVGIYFFGFQLTVAALSMFTGSLRAVFVPSFVALGDDRARQERAFRRALESGSMLLFLVIFAVAAIAEPIVSLVWSGKWDAAIPVIEIIAVASLARVVSPLALSLLEARGAWRTIAIMTWGEGLGLMASAGIGVLLGGLTEIALSVGAYMILIGLAYILVIRNHTNLSVFAIGKSVLGPYAIACGALVLAWTGADALALPPHSILDAVAKGGMYAAGFALLTALIGREQLHTAADAVRALRRHAGSSQPE